MFCPQCGVENTLEQRYCRQCGQALSSVRLVLEGRVDQAITTLKQEQKPILHRVRVGIGIFLMATAIATLITGHRVGLMNIESAAILLLITLFFFLRLVFRSQRVARLLNPAERPESLPAAYAANSPAVLPEAKTVALPSANPPTPMSVTEQSTLELNPKDRTKRVDA